jgi:hypothetical protein
MMPSRQLENGNLGTVRPWVQLCYKSRDLVVIKFPVGVFFKMIMAQSPEWIVSRSSRSTSYQKRLKSRISLGTSYRSIILQVIVCKKQ